MAFVTCPVEVNGTSLARTGHPLDGRTRLFPFRRPDQHFLLHFIDLTKPHYSCGVGLSIGLIRCYYTMSEPPPGSVPTTQALSSTAKLAAERDKKRIALKAKNLDVWAKGAKLPAGSLDSNMKKNTGFIKKVRQGLTADAKAQLVKEAATLNLDKYVEELVQAVPEGLAKCTTAKDSVAALEVRSQGM